MREFIAMKNFVKDKVTKGKSDKPGVASEPDHSTIVYLDNAASPI